MAASNWPHLRLEEVAEVAAGNPAPQDATDFCEDGEPFVRMQDVGREHRTSCLSVAVDKVSTEAIARHRLRLFPAGAVLVPKSGASVNLNHRAMLGRDAYVVSHLAVLVPNCERVIPEYLYAWSQSYDPRHQAQTTSLANADYDAVATLLDTDTDWDTKTEKLARTKKIQVLKSEPCFEAMMLRLIGKSTVGDAHALKRQFAPFVNNDATQRDHYASHFGSACLQTGRSNEPTIDALLKLLGNKQA